MSNSGSNTSLKYENSNLKEDLIFFKSQNFDFRAKIHDLEDEMRILKEKLKRAIATEANIEEDYQLGPHFPEKLLPLKEGK